MGAGRGVGGGFTRQRAEVRDATSLLRENLLTVEIEGEKTPALVAEWLGLAVFDG